jgi:hypothetical protein
LRIDLILWSETAGGRESCVNATQQSVTAGEAGAQGKKEKAPIIKPALRWKTDLT